ncbi:MobA-like NTP transferase domain protein [Peptostreptococcaceae bacterium AS15]|nr:MobA-like NTP transferase domain protein [Peptostreptococcaceae bacterium AS15]
MYDLSIIILASGLSKRMGQNKLLMDFKGKKMYQHCINSVKKCDIKQKIVVSAYDEILEYARDMGDFTIVKNENQALGQSQSIKMGIAKVNPCLGFVFLPSDMPFIAEIFLNKVCDFFMKDTSCIVVPRVEGKNSMPTIFPFSLYDELSNISGDIGGRDIIKANLSKVRYFDVKDGQVLQDIDTMEELEKYADI